MEIQKKVTLRYCNECRRKTLQVEVTKGDLSYTGGTKICFYCPQCGKCWEGIEVDRET